MMKTIIPIILVLLILGCSSTKENNTQDLNLGKEKSISNSQITTCQLIEKEFVNKGGKITEYKELYLRCSIQDYFIKLCDSKVSRKDLEPYIGKGISVKMEIKDGMWDHCYPNPAYAQSRMGTYVTILSIEK